MSLENLLSQIQQTGGASQGTKAQALALLQVKGLPKKSDEAWNYTSPRAAFEKTWQLATDTEASQELLKKVAELKAQGYLVLAFQDGFWVESQSAKELSAYLKSHQASLSGEISDGIEALQRLASPQTYEITIPKETSFSQPLALVHAHREGLFSAPSLKFSVGDRSQISVVEFYIGYGGSGCVNAAVEVQVAASAHLKWVYAQTMSTASFLFQQMQVTLQAHSQFHFLSFATGAKLSRQDLAVHVRGAGAHASINGLYVMSGDQHVDNTTGIYHHVGESTTHQLYKGILDGSGRSAFSGKVYIAKDAQKAQSEQLNNNLLLSSKAEADSRPMLQIYADDVKAAHGSTVGQLNKEEMFYLLSRAIPQATALKMLSYAYVGELIDQLEAPLIEQTLKQELVTAFAKLNVEGA